jgi:hypothetical protein
MSINKYFLLLFSILTILFLLSGVFSLNSINSENKKINEKVLQLAQKTGQVDVMIKYKSEGIEHKKIGIKELLDFQADNNIEKVLLSHPIKASLQQAVPLIEANRTWTLTQNSINLDGNSSVVCIIDTGINFNNPDLLGKNKTCMVDCFDKLCISNCSLGDDNGHGTHVAGIVAASGGIYGVAFNVSLIGVKVLDASGSGSGNDLDISRAIDYCVAQNVSVISMSLGTGAYWDTNCDSDFIDPTSPWATSIDAAYAKNISVVVAAGNNGDSVYISAPACITNAIPVGMTYDTNVGALTWRTGDSWSTNCTDSTTNVDKIVCASNRNSLVQLFAPGAMINSTWRDNSYAVEGGTSMATPVVSGVIAIVAQYLRLTGSTKTPSQIESALNSTGASIFDSSSGLTFSRINAYNALLSIDNQVPTVALISPTNNSINSTTNQVFSCNSSDWQLANVTLYLWNSNNALVYNETKSSVGTFNQTTFNVSNLQGGYKWNCLTKDIVNNQAFATNNNTLTVSFVSSTLSLPTTENYTNANSVDFNCSSETSSNFVLKNVTMYLWNSTNNLIYNLTKTINGTSNSQLFNYTFSVEGEYKWNCLTYNNNTNSAYASANSTIVYDYHAPEINLISPSTSVSYSTSDTITFSYNLSENYNLSACLLIINNATSLTNSTIIDYSITQNFRQSFSAGSYVWSINCSDRAGNLNSSNSRSFTITQASSSSGGGGGGGGGGGSSNKIYYTSDTDVLYGFNQNLGIEDKIKFNFISSNETHTLNLSVIGTSFATFVIQSDPLTFTLNIGEEKKLSINSTNFYDFYIKLNSIDNNKVNITVKQISEPIVQESRVINRSIDASDSSGGSGVININKNNYIVVFFIIIAVLIIIFILIIINKKPKNKLKFNKTKTKNETTKTKSQRA